METLAFSYRIFAIGCSKHDIATRYRMKKAPSPRYSGKPSKPFEANYGCSMLQCRSGICGWKILKSSSEDGIFQTVAAPSTESTSELKYGTTASNFEIKIEGTGHVCHFRALSMRINALKLQNDLLDTISSGRGCAIQI